MDNDDIRRDAKAAAETGRRLVDMCPWPFQSLEGRLFVETFIMHKAALAALGMNDKTLTPD